MLINPALTEARQRILESTRRLEAESVSPAEGCGRFAARDLFMAEDLPPGLRSAMDGYAIHEKDITEPCALKLVSEPGDLEKGYAMAVTTGQPVPPGTGAVIPGEKSEIRHGCLLLNMPLSRGENLRTPGEDFRRGEMLGAAGTRITPALAAVLAASGQERINVFRSPRVGIVALSPDVAASAEQPDKNPDSNGPLLSALTRQDGGTPVGLKAGGSMPENALRSLLADWLDQLDLILTTGATYSDSGQTLPGMFADMGIEPLFSGLRVQPGSHPVAGIKGDCLVLCLSGNPAACFVGYQLLAAPALAKMQGRNPEPVKVLARSLSAHPPRPGSDRYLRARLRVGQSGWEAELLPGQKPGMLRSLIDCNALLELKAGTALEKGGMVPVIHLPHMI